MARFGFSISRHSRPSLSLRTDVGGTVGRLDETAAADVVLDQRTQKFRPRPLPRSKVLAHAGLAAHQASNFSSRSPFQFGGNAASAFAPDGGLQSHRHGLATRKTLSRTISSGCNQVRCFFLTVAVTYTSQLYSYGTW